jgi:hypothetical protein
MKSFICHILFLTMLCPLVSRGQTLLNLETSAKSGVSGSALISNGTTTPRWKNLDSFSRYLPISTLPDFIPSESGIRSATVLNKATGLAYSFTGGKWYAQGTIVSTSAPPIELTTNIINSVVVNHSSAFWKNPSNGKIYYSDGTAWIELINAVAPTLPIATPHLIGAVDTLDQVFAGKKTFLGTMSAKAGINSDSTITSKGVNTEGSSTKAAAEFKGVLSMKDTLITSNYTATGAYGRITGDCSASNIVLTLPTPNASNLGWCYELSKKAASSFNFRVAQGSFSHVIFSPNKIVRVRQKGGFWELD